jgi:hypothetical protein
MCPFDPPDDIREQYGGQRKQEMKRRADARAVGHKEQAGEKARTVIL